MNSLKRLTLTGYAVEYVDLREPKPRQHYTEVYPIDNDTKDAITLLGLDLTDYIRSRYARAGFHCCTVDKISGKQIRYVDLRSLWFNNDASTNEQLIDTMQTE